MGRTAGEVRAEAGIGWERSPAALPAWGAHLQPGHERRAQVLVPRGELAGRMRKVQGSIPAPAPGQGKCGRGASAGPVREGPGTAPRPLPDWFNDWKNSVGRCANSQAVERLSMRFLWGADGDRGGIWG